MPEDTELNPEQTTGVAFKSILLDTTAPVGSFVIGTGAARINDPLVDLHATTTETDLIQVKIWGDVDPDFDPDVQPLQADSAWKSFKTADQAQDYQIRLATGDAEKHIYMQFRDDVYNESAAVERTVYLDNTIPVVTIMAGPTPNKISKVPGKNMSELSFACSEDFMEYKVCVVADTANGQAVGVLIQTANGSTNTSGKQTDPSKAYPASTPIDVTINGADLETASGGDGPKIIKIFVKDVAGNWSL